MPDYITNKNDAQGLAFPAETWADPATYLSQLKTSWTAKYGIVPLWNEVLALIDKVYNDLPVSVRNESGGQIDKGELVYISGYNTSEALLEISKADADDPAKAPQFVLSADIADSSNGTVFGNFTVTDLDTDAASAVGDPVYLSATAGEWTLTAPTGAGQAVYQIGVVTVKDAATGAIRFYPAERIFAKSGTSFLQDSAVTAAKLATDAVETAKIKDLNVTTGKIDDLAVTAAKIDADAVETVKIKDLNVTLAKMAALSVDENKLTASVAGAGIEGGAGEPLRTVLRGYIDGLICENDTDALHDVKINLGECSDDNKDYLLQLDTALVKQIDAAWAAGTNQGGLDTGSVAAVTWYYLYLIYNPTTDTVDALFTATLGSPTMPAGYTKKRLLWATKTDGSSDIIPSSQLGDEILWYAPSMDVSSSFTNATGQYATLRVPPGLKVWAKIRVIADSACLHLISSPDQIDWAPAVAGTPLITGANIIAADYGNETITVRTNTSGQVRVRTNSPGGVNLRIVTVGWTFQRGKNE